MRSTRTHRKAITALALGFAMAGLFTTTASAHVLGVVPHQQSAEISYLSWGATADDLGPFAAQEAPTFSRISSPAEAYAGQAEPAQVDPTLLPDGGNYDYSSDNSVASAARGARVGATQPDGYQPQTKTIETATVSASSDSFDRGDLALGFGLGLILATAAAIALSMTRDRQRTGMAHS